MTLPEHVICSVMFAQFGVRQRLGWKGVAAVALAGIAPDLDTVMKLAGDAQYWRLHHALGHGLLPLLLISVGIAPLARWAFKLQPIAFVWFWCLLAAVAHVLTDALYWWGIQVFWPFSHWELKLNWIEYLGLLVLALWLAGAFCLYRFPSMSVRIATVTLGLFVSYVVLRAVAPQPERGGVIHLITGGWMYAAPRGTPLLDWW